MPTRRCSLRPAGFAALACIFLAAPAAAQTADRTLGELEEAAFKKATALAAPAVVRIQTVGGLDRFENILTPTGPTTGVFVAEDGYIVSSAVNFISMPSSILVELPDGRRFPARMVASDRLKMITLLKIDSRNLPTVQPAPKDSLRVGQWAIALGRTYDSPLPSVSVGIVSALGRIWGKAVQTDAKVSPVNYGGPLIDIHGRAIGILVPLSPQANDETAGVEWYDSGIGFAVPIEDIYAVLDRLKQGDDLHPGLMGIEFSRNARLGERVEIEHVRVQSPAEKAGLKAGDVLTKINGQMVSRWSEAKFALGNRYAGDTIHVTVVRDDEPISTKLTLVEELLPYEAGFLGILPARRGVGESRADGVPIRHVFADSPASAAQLQPRDRIVALNGTRVESAAELAALAAGLRPGETAQLDSVLDGIETSVELSVSSIPNHVPAELRPSVIPVSDTGPPNDNTDGDGDAAPPQPNNDARDAPATDGPETGRFTVDMAAQGHSYWAYVPESYNPNYQYGLMVWIHPAGDTMEATVFNHWKSICDRRGIVVLGPKAAEARGWNPNEAEFVNAAVEELSATYNIDSRRVWLHGYADGGQFAYHLAFKYRDLFRGLAVAAQPLLATPPENKPGARLQIHLVCGDQDALYRPLRATVDLLRRMKYPTSFSTVSGTGRQYPPPAQLEEIGRWADCLDRI